MRIVGIDENGLGPRLGPLIATALTIEVETYDPDALKLVGARLKVGDSKQTSGFGRMAHAEGMALALAEDALGHVPEHADELLDAISLDGVLTLRSPCPNAATARQCWKEPFELPAFGGDVSIGRQILAALKEEGIRVRRLRTTVVCAGVLNDAMAAGKSKLQVDLSLFERLLLDARSASRGRILGICGMVGGMRHYADYFEHLEGACVLEEVKGRSAYEVPKLGEVAFEVKADDHHLPVGLASMVGKYMREIGMGRVIRFYRSHNSELPAASGYHDKVTRRFIDESRDLRKKLKIVDRCFLRRG